MRPSTIFAPCERCGIFPGVRHGYKCLCRQKPGDPFDYAEQDEDGQLSIGVAGEQRSIPGLAKPYQWEE